MNVACVRHDSITSSNWTYPIHIHQNTLHVVTPECDWNVKCAFQFDLWKEVVSAIEPANAAQEAPKENVPATIECCLLSRQWSVDDGNINACVCVCVRVCHTIVTFNCHVCLFFNAIITCRDPESRLPVIFIINIITIITTATVTVSYVMSLLFIAATDDAAPHRCQVATLASHAFPNILPMIQTCCRKRGLSKRIRIHDSWTHKILLNFRQIWWPSQ